MTVFSSDWFTSIQLNFEEIHKRLGTVSNILEVGSHEGRSACWMLQNMLSDDGTITCVDPFTDGPISSYDYHVIPEISKVQEIFNKNVGEAKKSTQTVNVLPTTSYVGLAKLIALGQQYDFIYVDGNHSAEEVLADAVMCFGLLKPGGIMLFDDYFWDHVPEQLDRPKASIDAFVNLFTRKLSVVGVNYQLAIQKNQVEKV